MYLFDTDTITNVFKKKPSEKLAKKLKHLDKAQQFVSTITIFEIVYGIYKSSHSEYHRSNLENILLPSVNIVGFDMKSAYICGKLRAELEKKGQPLALADLQIASIAMANNLTLITGNEKHFGRIDELKIENWL
ncbi:MAG: type II toxin-antitoxin system VapC family toxin [Deltaproteobacteria bacterium]|nr:MAG: type II toxin-antitoxin system VapC family toxin [Deltaproteobacteria bacterium]